MKILLVNQTFYPDVAATAQYLSDLALALVEHKHEVTVLTSQRSYLDRDVLYSKHEVYRGINIIRISSPKLGKFKKLSRITDALIINLLFGLKICFLPKFDKIIALTTPPLLAWFVLLASRGRHKEFIYWVMDVNPDQAIKAGWLGANSFIAQIFERIQRYIMDHTHKIIVLDRQMKNLLVAKGTDSKKIFVSPLWSDLEESAVIPHQENSFRRTHQLNGKFVIMYSGNHSICHPLDTLLEAARLMRNDDSVIFLFIGGGLRVKEVQEFKEEHSLANILQLPYQDNSQLVYSLSAADLHVVIMGDPYSGIIHPSKIYRIIALGRPFIFIGPKESFVGELIYENHIGCHIAHGDTQGLIESIASLRPDANISRPKIGLKNNHKLADFSKSKIVPEIVSLIENA